MRHDALTVDEKLVALRLAAEDRVVVEHETPSTLALLEEYRRGQPAQPTADAHHVIGLTGVHGARDRALERSVAHGVRGGHHIVRVPVRPAVVADAAVAGPVLSGRFGKGK